MSEEFGNDYLTIEDEEGNTFELEVLGGFDFEDRSYMAALPADMEETDPDFGIILLRIEEEDGEEIFASIDDDDELEAVYQALMDLIYEDGETIES